MVHRLVDALSSSFLRKRLCAALEQNIPSIPFVEDYKKDLKQDMLTAVENDNFFFIGNSTIIYFLSQANSPEVG